MHHTEAIITEKRRYSPNKEGIHHIEELFTILRRYSYYRGGIQSIRGGIHSTEAVQYLPYRCSIHYIGALFKIKAVVCM